jgi:hypothetical protein
VNVVVLVAIVIVILVPLAALVLRFRRGDEMVAGGSDGLQMRRRKRGDELQ